MLVCSIPVIAKNKDDFALNVLSFFEILLLTIAAMLKRPVVVKLEQVQSVNTPHEPLSTRS